MKNRILFFVKIYLLYLLLFVLQKPLFMLCHTSLYADRSWVDWLQVMYHGLPLDRSLAGYLSVLPGLLLVVSVWTSASWLRRLFQFYFGTIALLLSLILTVNIGLYAFWGFPLDATPLFYFFSSPKDAVASVSVWMVIGGVLAVLLYALLVYALFHACLLRPSMTSRMKLPYHPLRVSLLLLLFTGLLFIPIRGGLTVSTMNVGQAYFSDNLRLNHAAVNPAFSLMESLSKQKDFSKQYRFMEPDEADSLFVTMQDASLCPQADSVAVEPMDTLFTTSRPDILFVILESFSSRLLTALGGEPDIAPCLDSLCHEGVLFTRFYANSFRTDRGLVSVLSGYPAQPTTSIMKYPRKTQHLPSICGALRQAGYSSRYYYGGDADFTNMRSYLMSSGFESIVSDVDFPVSERLSKWGVHDHLVFARLLDELKKEVDDDAADAGRIRPAFRVLQTSSSHEPYEVPYRRLQNDRLNAFAYADSCVGNFIRAFRRLPQWQHTVVVLVPDHLGCYPEGISNLTFERYQIPLLMVGGAIRNPRRIDVCGSQHDLAATLLAQLGLPHNEFRFSKDMLHPVSPHFAFFTVPDAFGMVTDSNRVIYDCQAGQTVLDEGTNPGENLSRGMAYLQKLYDDLAAR